VNTWGLLGLGDFGAEPVIAVRHELKSFQHLAQWAAAMGREEWKSPDIPPLPASYGSPSWQQQQRLLRRRFAGKFDEAIRRLGIFARPVLLAARHKKTADKRRQPPPVKPAFRPEPGLLGVLYFELFRVMVDPETKLQACAAGDCTALFIKRTSNELTKYCSRRCRTRDKVRAFRLRRSR
jgi:hypothetical protein